MTQASLQTTRDRIFRQVDVFTAIPYRGNPLAVVQDGTGLGDDAMQRFARWTNLSETTFLLPPVQAGADYRVRIFTPGGELPFAGHPTLGSCHAWLQGGGVPQRADVIVQECAVGLVQMRSEPSRLAFAAPPMTRSSPSPALLAQVAGALGLRSEQIIAAQMLDNGTAWMGLLLDRPDTVLRLVPDHPALKRLGQKVGVAAIHGEAGGAASPTSPGLEVRGFAAPIGIDEDPVTGALNASLAQWLIDAGHLPRAYVAAQGTCLDRAGRVHIERDDAGQVWVGGACVTCISGMVSL